MTSEAEDSVNTHDPLDDQRRGALRCVLIIIFLMFTIIAGGSFACVFFGVSEIIKKDTILMNDGLGEVMTILGICFILPCLFCIIAFLVIALDVRCCNNASRGGRVMIMLLVFASVVAQQVLSDTFLFSIFGPVATVAIIFDVSVIGCYLYCRLQNFYLPTVLCVMLFVGKFIALWSYTTKPHDDPLVGPNGIRVVLFLTLPIAQFPLYVIPPQTDSFPWTSRWWQVMFSTEDTIVENFNNHFNIFLLHLLNSLDIVSIYTSFMIHPDEVMTFDPVPEPFRILVIAIISFAFIGNNVGLIHLFFARDEVDKAELKLLPKRLREATNQWSSADASGSHKRRMLQYMLLLLVVCDVPLLAVRAQLWLRGYQMLSVFLAKNIKSILDVVMVFVRVDRAGGHPERAHYLLAQDS